MRLGDIGAGGCLKGWDSSGEDCVVGECDECLTAGSAKSWGTNGCVSATL